MAGTNVAALNGLFKTVYADKLLDLVPDFAVLQKKIPFSPADKETGAFYAQPINLASEAGFTYNGTAGTIVTLNAAVSGQMKEAQVYGSELVLRAQLSYVALSRASKAGPKAFKRASAWKVEDMNNAMRKRLECALIYGQVGVGTVSAAAAGVITISAASWAGGIWAGAEGSILEAFDATTATANQHNTDLVITAVDSDNRNLTVSGTSAAVVAGDTLYFKGARTTTGYNEMAGLQKIITNTGTLFAIDASAYSLFKGNTSSSTGTISLAKLQTAVAKAVNKGLMEKCMVLLSPKNWGTLNSDLAALRVFDQSYGASKGEAGNEALVYHSTNGQLEVISHPLVKDGDAFIVPEGGVQRIGSVDLSFGVPGMEEEFFTLVPATNAIELQCMADQAIFLEKPAHCVYMSGIS